MHTYIHIHTYIHTHLKHIHTYIPNADPSTSTAANTHEETSDQSKPSINPQTHSVTAAADPPKAHQTQNPDRLFQFTEHQTADKQNAPKRQPLLDGLLQKGRTLANRNSKNSDRKTAAPGSQGACSAGVQSGSLRGNENENVCVEHNRGGGLCDGGDILTSRNRGGVVGVRADSEACRMDVEAT
jgi:hypothetical protein